MVTSGSWEDQFSWCKEREHRHVTDVREGVADGTQFPVQHRYHSRLWGCVWSVWEVWGGVRSVSGYVRVCEGCGYVPLLDETRHCPL